MEFKPFPKKNQNKNIFMTLSNILTPARAFAAVAFFIGELGDGLNYFQAVYLVGLGWNESAVGFAISLMGFTTLFMQTCAGDIVDKTTVDRRILLSVASLLTAGCAMSIMFVREGNQDHMLMYVTKVIEGVACSFTMPCLTALTLANFGPELFDNIMASNVFWGLVGYAISSTIVGIVAYVFYPTIKMCFLIIGIAAVAASVLSTFLPQGDPKVGSGFRVETLSKDLESRNDALKDENTSLFQKKKLEAASYWSVFSDRNILIFCLTGFFFHLSNANVVIVLGELMGQGREGEDAGQARRNAIPLMAAGQLISQFFMCSAVSIGDYYTKRGVGRKPLFLAGIATLPLRCALIILWKDAGPKLLLLTQIFDGLEGGFFRVIHPYVLVDLTYGTGRFNVIMGLSNSFFWFGRTFSTLLGQIAVERWGHAASIYGSMFVSCVPIIIFSIFMPETLHLRLPNIEDDSDDISVKDPIKKVEDSDYLKMT